jgi:hypothetical protein
VRGPGYDFIERYEHGLPQTRPALARCVKAFGAFLRRVTNQANQARVDLGLIFTHFGLHSTPVDFKANTLEIEGANLTEMGFILFDDSDPATRQRFTQAHELIECLVTALRGNKSSSSVRKYLEGTKKEKLCNWGAARLLMPTGMVRATVKPHKIGILEAERVAQAFGTSRLSTVRRMVNIYPKKCGIAVWKRAHKPSERALIPSPDQGTLWPDIIPKGPPKKMRLQWHEFGRRVADVLHLRKHESVPDGSLIARVEKQGGLVRDRERFNLSGLEGPVDVEATSYHVSDEVHVLSLFLWPPGMLAGQDVQGQLIRDKRAVENSSGATTGG